ncbi:hypothetical protein CVT26_007452, partial [Gymnopilus dilepis]
MSKYFAYRFVVNQFPDMLTLEGEIDAKGPFSATLPICALGGLLQGVCDSTSLFSTFDAQVLEKERLTDCIPVFTDAAARQLSWHGLPENILQADAMGVTREGQDGRVVLNI